MAREWLVWLLLLLSSRACVEGSCVVKKAVKKNSFLDLVLKAKSLDLTADSTLKVFIPTSHVVETEACKRDSAKVKAAVQSGEVWALKMVDASSKLPVGVFSDNLIDLGSYDQCLGVEDIGVEGELFSGQHCLVTMGEASVFTELDFFGKREQGFTMRETFPDHVTLGRAPITRLMKNISLTWSVCVPSTCSARDVEMHLRYTMRNILKGALDKVPINVTEMGCNSRAKKTAFNTWDWMALYVISFYACLVFISSAYDLFCSPSGRVSSTFSVFRHFAHLKRGATSDGNLAVLDGIRALSVLWVMAVHRSMFTVFTPAINPTRVREIYHDWTYQMVNNGSLCTDSFFLLSGLLVTFKYLQYRQSGKTFSLVQFYLYRYTRTTPLLMVMIGLGSTIATYAGDGPFWKVNMAVNRENCEKNYLWSLLYISNYIPFREMCIGQTWYLSADMQLYWFSPLVLYPLWKQPKLGKALLAALILLGLCIAVFIPYYYHFKVMLLETGLMGLTNYFPTYARCTPWLLGVGLGYVLHCCSSSVVKMSRITSTLGWILSLTLMSAAIILNHFFVQPDQQFSRFSTALYIGLMRPAWVIGLSWMIFACVTGYGGLLNTFLSHRIFLLLSRLSYSIFFTHVSVMMYAYAIVKTPIYISVPLYIGDTIRDVILSCITGLIFHLTFESPLNYILDVLLTPTALREKSKNL